MQGWRGLQPTPRSPAVARGKTPCLPAPDGAYFTGIGVEAATGTAVTAFMGLPSMSLSE